MSKKSILVLMFVLCLGFTMLACTTGSRSSRYPRYPNYPNYPGGQGYPGYPPGYNTGQQQIEVLADHLKDATAEVTEEAKDTLQQNDFEGPTMTLLEDLEREANEFHSNLDDRRDSYREPAYGDPRYGDPRYGGYPGNGGPRREQFTEVLQKYYAARKNLNELSQEGEVQKDFERVTSIMRNLTRLYGYRFDPDYDYLEPTIR